MTEPDDATGRRRGSEDWPRRLPRRFRRRIPAVRPAAGPDADGGSPARGRDDGGLPSRDDEPPPGRRVLRDRRAVPGLPPVLAASLSSGPALTLRD